MKRKNWNLLLTIFLLSSCGAVTTNQTSESESAEENSQQLSEEQSLSEDISSEVVSSEEELSSEEVSSEESVSEEISSESEISEESTSVSEEPKEPTYHEKNITNYLGSDGDVYRINITTENNDFPQDKENYVSGSLNITEQDTSKVLMGNKSMGIRLRGNSTVAACKKPFRIKFDKKQSLFGLDAAKNWCLLANYYDKTNIRNYLAYIMANKLDGLYFQPSSIMVDVYYNNEYLGLYTLCEQMEANAGRVDIKGKTSEDGIDSFFLEQDERAKDEYPNQEGTCYLKSMGYSLALKYPDCDDYLQSLTDINSEDEETANDAKETKEQYEKDIAWLKTFLSDTAKAVLSHSYSNYCQYIDVNSFIDYYLIQELFKNVDVGSTSQYYFIDTSEKNPKLYAGPVWDFDISAGVVDINSSDIYSGYANSTLFMRSRDYYDNQLFNDSFFEQLVKLRYSEVRDTLYEVFDEMEIAVNALEKAQARNLAKWSLPGERTTWVEIYAVSDACYSYTTLDAHYSKLKRTLKQRFSIMDENYL